MPDNFSQNSWSDKESGPGTPENVPEGEFPMTTPGAPKMPGVEVRTFGSDIASVQDSGGGSPKPYAPAASPENPVFVPPEVPAPAPGSFPEETAPRSKTKKGLFLTLFIVIVVIGLGAVGYFLVYPLLFSGTAESPVVETPTAPIAETPTSPQVPTIPTVPTASEAPVVQPTEEGAPVPGAQISEHQSFLKTAADVSTNITLDALSPNSIKDQIGFSTAQVPVLKEIVFKNSKGVILTAGDIMGTLLPDVLAGASSRPLFELDFTFLTYTNDKGTWLAAVLKLFGDTSLAEAKTAVEKIESSANLKNLFIVDPGTPSTWKSGTVSGVANRYLSFTQAGASLNYGWQGNLLIVSTSFPGFQEALKRLQ